MLYFAHSFDWSDFARHEDPETRRMKNGDCCADSNARIESHASFGDGRKRGRLERESRGGQNARWGGEALHMPLRMGGANLREGPPAMTAPSSCHIFQILFQKSFLSKNEVHALLRLHEQSHNDSKCLPD